LLSLFQRAMSSSAANKSVKKVAWPRHLPRPNTTHRRSSWFSIHQIYYYSQERVRAASSEQGNHNHTTKKIICNDHGIPTNLRSHRVVVSISVMVLDIHFSHSYKAEAQRWIPHDKQSFLQMQYQLLLGNDLQHCWRRPRQQRSHSL
jgi:hypothetical protein